MLLKIVQKMHLLHSAFYNKRLILLSESQWKCWSYLKYNKFIQFIYIILYIRPPLIENIENNMATHDAFLPMLGLPKIQYIWLFICSRYFCILFMYVNKVTLFGKLLNIIKLVYKEQQIQEQPVWYLGFI